MVYSELAAGDIIATVSYTLRGKQSIVVVVVKPAEAGIGSVQWPLIPVVHTF